MDRSKTLNVKIQEGVNNLLGLFMEAFSASLFNSKVGMNKVKELC